MTIPSADTFFRTPSFAQPIGLGGELVGVWPARLELVRVARLGGAEVRDYGTVAALWRGGGVVDVWTTGTTPGALLLLGVDTTCALAFFSDADSDRVLAYDLVAGAWVDDGDAAELPRLVLEDDGERFWIMDLEQGWQHHLIEAVDADFTEPALPSRRTA